MMNSFNKKSRENYESNAIQKVEKNKERTYYKKISSFLENSRVCGILFLSLLRKRSQTMRSNRAQRRGQNVERIDSESNNAIQKERKKERKKERQTKKII